MYAALSSTPLILKTPARMRSSIRSECLRESFELVSLSGGPQSHADRVVVHEYGLFKFKTGLSGSQPSTPSSIRSRAALFGLDALALSRSLFNVRAINARGDFMSPNGSFGSGRGHRRTKSSSSKVSSNSTNTEFKFSSRSNSTATQATTLTMDSVQSSSKIPRKLVRRPISPGPGMTSGSEAEESPTQHRKRAYPRDPDSGYEGDATDDERHVLRSGMPADSSEYAINQRLALARQNSLNQQTLTGSPRSKAHYAPPVEDTIYESEHFLYVPTRKLIPCAADEPPHSILRPPSRASQQSKDSHLTVSAGTSRSNSQVSDRRPMGPRAPSPKPPRSPSPRLDARPLPDHHNSAENIPLIPETPHRSEPLNDRGSRRPLESRSNTGDDTPRARGSFTTPKRPVSAIEPLSIKKKNSVKESSPPRSLSKNAIGADAAIEHKRSRSLNETNPDADIPALSDNEKRLVDDLISIAESTRVDVCFSLSLHI
jgi:hypothetical protein